MADHMRHALPEDIPAIVSLSEQKRIQYESYQPLFWRKAEDSRDRQAAFLQHQLTRDNIIALVHERDGEIDGFAIATLVPSPPVYAAGLTCAIDDFCVVARDWLGIGKSLLEAAMEAANQRGASQSVVVCGHLDESKRHMLSTLGFTIASEWWTRPI